MLSCREAGLRSSLEPPVNPSTGSLTDPKKDGKKKPSILLVIAAIILYGLVLGLIVYSFINIHVLVNDPCQICVEETGGTCNREGQLFANYTAMGDYINSNIDWDTNVTGWKK